MLNTVLLFLYCTKNESVLFRVTVQWNEINKFVCVIYLFRLVKIMHTTCILLQEKYVKVPYNAKMQLC